MDRENITLLIEEIQQQYVSCRRRGCTRDEAITLIREEYECELNDDDDRIAVLIGLALALCKRKELLQTIADETLAEIQTLKQQYVDDSYLTKIEKKLADVDLYGDEATYKRGSIYKPDWVIGDTFSHVLTHPLAEEIGIMGWHILFYKVGEHIDRQDACRQLMCVSLCPPDKIPTCYEELKNLGFLPMMQLGERFEYLAQIKIKSKRTENTYEFTKIGCFPNDNDAFIERCKEENPLTTMPFFGRLKANDLRPFYEEHVCRLYKKFRKTI